MSDAHGTRFVGRHAELGALRAELDAALGGEGRLVVLLGEPGIGKTRTATALAAEARERGGGGGLGALPRERGRAGVLALGAGAGRLRDRASRATAAARSRRCCRCCAPERAARGRARARPSGRASSSSIASSPRSRARPARQPLLVVLDDLHWADAGSLLLLEFVARELGTMPLLVLGTARDVELRSVPIRPRCSPRWCGSGAACRSSVSPAPRCASS